MIELAAITITVFCFPHLEAESCMDFRHPQILIRHFGLVATLIWKDYILRIALLSRLFVVTASAPQ